MDQREVSVNLFDMVLCFSRALDLLHPCISDHHLQVANIAAQIGEVIGLSFEEQQDLLIAGALHDVGSVSVAARLALLDYSLATYSDGAGKAPENIHKRGFEGWLLLRDFAPFARAASIIRYHHVRWDNGRGATFAGEAVPLCGHILHLADRIAVLPRSGENILDQRDQIVRSVRALAGTAFQPELIVAFEALAAKESFWFDLAYPHKEMLLRRRASNRQVALGVDELQDLAAVFGRIIDFRSPFTATHSSGVAATAGALAALLGMGEQEQKLMRVAGHLHDLGKLAVPPEILDKPGPLSPAELNIVRSHTYHTYRILETVPSLETINVWASFHHERLDGHGYPFQPDVLPLGSRIVAVADVFTALNEDRPYRQGMLRSEVLDVLAREVTDRALDGDVVAAVVRNFEQLECVRLFSQGAGSGRSTRVPASQGEAFGDAMTTNRHPSRSFS